MDREVFKAPSGGRNDARDPFSTTELSESQYLDTFFSKHSSKFQAAGFKIMLKQLTPEILTYFQRGKIKCIHLDRKNEVKLAISRLAARRKLIYHSTTGYSKSPIPISTVDLDLELKEIHAQKEQCANITKTLDSLHIEYDDLVNDKDVQLKKILKFLGVKSTNENLHSGLKKITADDLNLSTLNYKEIFDHFANTQYSKFLTPLKEQPKPYSSLNDIHQCIFIHIPKVAGSSIENALWGTRGRAGHKTALEYKKADQKLFQKYFSFAFVRNPYDRFVSAYEYLIRGGRNRYDKAWAEENLKCYPSFSSFVLALQDEKVKKKTLNWSHFKPQYRFVCDENGSVIADYIGRYETLEKSFDYVTIKLKIDANLPHENAIDRQVFSDYYTEETKSIVRNIYHKDFELFSYD
jgi:hypothetical protein